MKAHGHAAVAGGERAYGMVVDYLESGAAQRTLDRLVALTNGR